MPKIMFRADGKTICKYRIAALLCLVQLGCASYVPAPELGTAEYRESNSVLLQICIPNGSSSDGIGLTRISRYGDRGEMRSSVSMRAEPVYAANKSYALEAFTHNRQIDLVAVVVRVKETTYTFDVTKTELTLDRWSAWEPPISENSEKEQVWYRLANQREIVVRPLGHVFPVARYRLIRTIDWWNKEARPNYDLPRCP